MGANTSPPKKPRGLVRIIKAAGYSWAGLKAAFQHEAAVRQEVILLAAALSLLLWLQLPLMDSLMMFSVIVLVIIVELLNSAIEAVVDRVGEERHELSGRAKDIGSAAVFVSLLLAGVVWIAILWHHFGAQLIH
ncbi:diacylglycerol kinase [Salinivibrio socompensis]|uniref:diacylglycerol kinase n=1 Tax=Salinivibrio socompensis TaxID=1510206 RepID=UPI00046EFFC1|nr:diacylglycerol kinase [Salinivibrio socompensis]